MSEVFKGWDWEKNSDSYWSVPDQNVYFLAEHWKKLRFKKILDLGCGLGRHSKFLCKRGFDVSSMDISQYAVDLLNEWSASNTSVIDGQLHAVQGNMLDLPYPDCSFDALLSFNVVYHTDTVGFEKCLAELKRVLKPNGEMFITLITKNAPSYLKAKRLSRGDSAESDAEKFSLIDENTVLIREGRESAETDVPHFYVDTDDIARYFLPDFDFVRNLKEVRDIELTKDKVFTDFSHHYFLHLRKHGD